VCVELEGAWHSDQQALTAQFQATSNATGREPETFRRNWIASLARLSDDELESLQTAQYPRATAAWSHWKEHAAVSGHRLPDRGWRSTFIFDAMRRGYPFLK
jgi:hypothetical protein